MTTTTKKMPERIYLTDFGYECDSCRTKIGQSYPDNDPENDCVLYTRADVAYPVSKEAAREAIEVWNDIIAHCFSTTGNPDPEGMKRRTRKARDDIFALLEAASK